MKKLEIMAQVQHDKVNSMIDNDYKIMGKISSESEIEGLWSGFLSLHGDSETTLISAFESRDKERLEILKLMLIDELYYVNKLLEGE